MANIQSELKALSDALTGVIKDVIKDKGLVDTGKLYNSIRVIPSYSNGNLSLDIEAEDYFEFVDNKYNIMETALKNPKWDRTLEDSILQIIEKQIK